MSGNSIPSLTRTRADQAMGRLEELVVRLGPHRGAIAWVEGLSDDEARAMAMPYALAAARKFDRDQRAAAEGRAA